MYTCIYFFAYCRTRFSSFNSRSESFTHACSIDLLNPILHVPWEVPIRMTKFETIKKFWYTYCVVSDMGGCGRYTFCQLDRTHATAVIFFKLRLLVPRHLKQSKTQTNWFQCTTQRGNNLSAMAERNFGHLNLRHENN